MIIDGNKSQPQSLYAYVVCRHKSISARACRTQSELNPVRAKKYPVEELSLRGGGGGEEGVRRGKGD